MSMMTPGHLSRLVAADCSTLFDIGLFMCTRPLVPPDFPAAAPAVIRAANGSEDYDKVTDTPEQTVLLMGQCKRYVETQWDNANVTGLCALLWLTCVSLTVNVVFIVIATRCAMMKGTFRKRGRSKCDFFFTRQSPFLPSPIGQRSVGTTRVLFARRAVHVELLRAVPHESGR